MLVSNTAKEPCRILFPRWPRPLSTSSLRLKFRSLISLQGWRHCTAHWICIPSTFQQTHPRRHSPGVGEGVASLPREVLERAGADSDQPPTENDMMKLFFYPSETSFALGHAWWKRIHERNVGEPGSHILPGLGLSCSSLRFSNSPPIPATSIIYHVAHCKKLRVAAEDRQCPAASLPYAGHGHLFRVPELR